MKKNKLWLLTFLTIALLAFVTACGNSSSSGDSKDSKGNASNKDEASGSITISGSSAMQPLVLAAAEKFMDKHPKADIQVQAGGSGTGLSQVSEGSVQIGNSDVFAEEKDGIDAKALKDHKVAVVGMAAAVNPEVGVKDITKDELKKSSLVKSKTGKSLAGKTKKSRLSTDLILQELVQHL